MPSYWNRMLGAPHILESLYDLAKSSCEGASLNASQFRLIDRAVLGQLRAEYLLDHDDDRVPASESDATWDATGGTIHEDRAKWDACRRFAVQLTSRLHTITENDRNDLRRHGVNEREMIDLIFRVAVVNIVGRLERFLCWSVNAA